MSAAGRAFMTLPPTVARFRMSGEPMIAAASRSAPSVAGSAPASASAAIVVVGPTRTRPPSIATPSSSSSSASDITTRGVWIGGTRRAAGQRASVAPALSVIWRMLRIFMLTTRSVPPASGLSAAPCSPSSASASPRHLGRSYENS